MASAVWQTADEFAELYVISDLHMGGEPGFQIFNQGQLLAQFIDRLAAREVDGTLGLVINGDMVDFLAARQATYFDPLGASAKLLAIADEPAFRDVFAALKRFTGVANRRLIITLGNHDLELALPWMQSQLLGLLAKNEAARARIKLAFDGEGYVAKVGAANVYCVHGNDVDEWNVTDYETIRRQGRDLMQGQAVDAWIPNAGTKLVIEVMNEIKGRFPFVDLLKPELEAVVPTLYALDPSLKSKIGGVLSVAARLTWDKIRIKAGFLSAELEAEPDTSAPTRTAVNQGEGLVDALLYRSVQPQTDRPRSAEQLLSFAQREVSAGKFASDQVPSRSGETLGVASAIRGFFGGDSEVEVLRRALEDLRHDKSFDRSNADATFQRMDELVSPDAAFVVTGHTHMERARKRERGRGFYFNSGTWVRLIQLDESWLRDEWSFKPMYKAFQAGTMDALDQLQSPKPLVTLAPCAVQIRREGNRTRACLLRPALDGAELGTVVDGIRFDWT